MRSFTLTLGTAGAATTLLLSTAAPAAAAQEPSDHASCLATIFQAQAVGEPRTVSNRILYIRDVELQGGQFGQVLKPLARGTFEFCP
jgi:hypothetical protein